LDKFHEAQKVFRAFDQNLEEWVYKVLIQHHRSEKDTWAQKEVREKAWRFIGDISTGITLFPQQWNYETDKHEDAPWGLSRVRTTNIRRYQKSFREFLDALEGLIEAEGGTVERDLITEQFELGGMTVVVHSLSRKERGQTHPEAFLRDLKRQAGLIARAGLRKALDGLTVHVRFDRHDLTTGQYQKESDELVIFPLGMSAGKGATTFIHEVGHRLYYRFLQNRARAHWEEMLESHTAEITPTDVKVFMNKIWVPSATSRELQHVVDRSEFDPESKAKFNYLADHNPAYTNEAEGVEKHHEKFNVGDKVTIEHISDYGATNPIEAFAEAFQLYVRKGPRALGPWTRHFFERITKPGSQRYAYVRRLEAPNPP